MTVDPAWLGRRRNVLTGSAGISLAVGAYGISFGAVSVATGLTVWQAQALSALMFTGGSQFALVGVLANGGSPVAAAATSILIGVRNLFYALRMAPLLQTTGLRRIAAAQLTIDESTGMALRQLGMTPVLPEDGEPSHSQQVQPDLGQPDRGPGRTGRAGNERAARLGFWATGIGVFAAWNLATLLGSVATSSLTDPRALGLDAAIPAGFLALLWPQLATTRARVTGLAAAAAVLALTPLLPPGAPVLLAAAIGIGAGLLVPQRVAGAS